jgi:DNA-binding SARP family transcriptional activator/WD40 repeat protein
MAGRFHCRDGRGDDTSIGQTVMTDLVDRADDAAPYKWAEQIASIAGMGEGADLRILVLGPLEVWLCGAQVPLTGVPASVLAVLARTPGRVVGMDAVVTGLWGECPPTGARRAVVSYVARLRRILTDAGKRSGVSDAASVVATRAPGYMLEVDPSAVDVVRFEALAGEAQRAVRLAQPDLAAQRFASALELWRGDPYAEFGHLPFVAAERLRLEEFRLNALEAMIEARLELVDPGVLLPEVEACLADHPYRERLWGYLMLALYRSGRQGDALSAFRRARRRLVDELGVEPGPDLRDLERRILRAEPTLDTHASRRANVPTALARLGDPCVGREAELDRLCQGLQFTAYEASQLMVVCGPPGIGKTRLLAELADRVASRVASISYGPALVATAHKGLHLALIDDVERLDGFQRRRVVDSIRQGRDFATLVVATTCEMPPPAELGDTPVLQLGPLSGEAVAAVVRQYAPDADDAEVLAAAGDSGGVPGRLHRAAATWAAARAAQRIERASADVHARQRQLRLGRDELVASVLDLGHARSNAAAPAGVAAVAGVCPYKGLARYEPADAAYFFGRDRLVAELVAHLIGSPLLAVVGASGTGKSSVVRAGLLPALQAGVLPGSAVWRLVVTTPSTTRDLSSLVEQADVLVVDQFEEVFTDLEAEMRTAFVEGIVSAAGARSTILLTLRADFYGRCAEFPALADLVAANHVVAGPMTVDELRQVLIRPAALAGLNMEPSLAEVLWKDVREAPGALPLLSTALMGLWERRHGDLLTLAAYRDAGGIAGAVEALGERAWAALASEEDRQAARRMLVRLAASTEDAAHTGLRVGRKATVAELLEVGFPCAASVLNVFTAGRLLTRDEDAVEVAHEALLSRWARLRDWLDEDAAGRDFLAHVSPAARSWAAHDRDAGLLYRGARLAAAVEWADTHGDGLTGNERDFLHASRQAVTAEARQARRSIRRLRAMLAATVAAAVIAAVAGVAATIQQRHAETAQRIADAARLGVLAQTEQRADLTALLAVQAVTLNRSAQTRADLLSAILRRPQVRRVTSPLESRLFTIDVSPDGSTIAVGDNQGRVALVDRSTWRRRGPVLDIGSGPYVVNNTKFSPDGRYVIGISANDQNTQGIYSVWDAATGKRVRGPATAPLIGGLLWAPPGSPLTAITNGPTAGTWTGTIDAMQPTEHAMSGYWVPAGFSRDGRQVLVVDDTGWATWRNTDSWAPTSKFYIGLGLSLATLSPDGATVAIGYGSGTTKLRDAHTGQVRVTLSDQHGGVNDIRFDATGTRVVTVAGDGTAIIWDTASGRQIGSIGGVRSTSATFAPGSTDRIYVTSEDGTLLDVDLSDGLLDHRILGPADPANTVWPTSGAPLIADSHGTVSAWETTTNAARTAGRPLGGSISATARVPETLLVAVGTADGLIALLGADATFNATLGQEASGVLNLAAGADQRVFAVLGNGHVTAYDARTRTLLWNRELEPTSRVGDFGPRYISYDSQRHRLAVGFADGTVRLLDPASGDTTRSINVDGQPVATRVAFDPTSGDLIATTRAGMLHYFDPDSGRPAGEPITGPPTIPDTLIVADHGSHAATLGDDGTVAVFDLNAHVLLALLPTATAEPTSIALSPDGNQLLVVETDGTATIWNLDETSWITAGCTQAGRQLTIDEWRRFLPDRDYAPAC